MVRTPPETVEKVKVRHFSSLAHGTFLDPVIARPLCGSANVERKTGVSSRSHLLKYYRMSELDIICTRLSANYTIGLLRACNLKALVYLNEGSEKLIKEYLDAD
ncbi:hypothetical protein AALO_G00270940 [Alosa alosa]|uniref:Dinitrogenase iron-molybdenum cofactor biosynthesis domain-containing protein n=1 Tax=Alosa alosa TaxID=278164 RepID=A0AAV6FSB0_9TELE|nr:hypothetical protein AALO_G00270940 [Alosa alosa]